ncbi:MAG: extracellular solute-binding protein [Rhodospirillaceae bacterium]|nr:extracellular solute-binding protein [Rhodospirillaceae bacterium]
MHTTQEELGSAFGPGKQPFKGVTISVTVNAGGPKGGISGPLYEFRPIWEELSGGKVNIVELPFAEHYTKMMLDLRNGTGDYDAFMVGAFWYGDIVPTGYVLSIDDMQKSGKYPKWSYDDMPPSLRNLYTWEGAGYGVLNDADGQVLYYRRDVLNDPKWQAEFKKEVGYDMPVPPKTWQQLLDIAKFFNGKNWDNNDPDPDSGIVLHLKVGEQGHYHFQSLSASFAITPGPKLDRYHNVYWFDPTDMTPLINSPGHVKALEFLQELHKTGPAAEVGWSLGEAWDYFLRGKAVFVFSWGDVGGLCEDTSRSKIKGNCASAMLPASDEYYDMEKKEWVKTDNPQPIGNTTGGSWHGVISAFSKNPEATYSFLSLMAIKPVSKLFATIGWDGVDPGYKYQMLKPEGDATIEDYTAAGWDENDVKDYLKAYYDNFNAKTMLPYLRIPGTFEYWDILDKNLSAAMAGQMSAKEALDATAASWEQVTDRIGRDSQLKAYQAAIGYKP